MQSDKMAFMQEVMKKHSRLQNQESKPKRQSPEKDIQHAIFQFLRIKNVFCWRNNTGSVKMDDRFVSFGMKGSSDLFALHKGMFYAIEVKAPKGVQSPAQKQFQSDVEVSGGVYVLARSVDDVIRLFT